MPKPMAAVLAEHVIIGSPAGQYACTNVDCGWELIYRNRMYDLKRGRGDVVAYAFGQHQEFVLRSEGYGEVVDEWEYNIEATDSKTGSVSLYRELWEPKADWLLRKLEEIEDVPGSWYSYRLVKRRKAGPVESA